MPTTYLIIAHLLADFILQPTKLIEWKKRNATGTLVHVLIFIALSCIILFPYLYFWQSWIVIFAIGAIHFAADQYKIRSTRKNGHSYAMPFLFDQAVHLLSIIIGGEIIKLYIISFNYINLNLSIGILIAIYVVYCFFIYFLQKSESRKVQHIKLITFTIAFILYLIAAILF